MGSSQSCCIDRQGGRRGCCIEYEGRMSDDRYQGRGGIHPVGFQLFGSQSDSQDAHDNNTLSNSRRNSLDDKKFQEHIRKILSRNGPGHVPEPRRGSGQSSWIEAPDPLPGWSAQEQDAFIEILKDHPKAARDSSQLELAVVKAIKKLNKTEAQLIQCFQHVQHCRVAYFGDIGAKEMSPNQRSSHRRRFSKSPSL
jgi:hypothetical protein